MERVGREGEESGCGCKVKGLGSRGEGRAKRGEPCRLRKKPRVEFRVNRLRV